MRPYWGKVIELLDVLAYIVKQSDPDGPELYFTISNSYKRSRKSSDLVQQAKENCPPAERNGFSDIYTPLEGILSKYKDKMDDHQSHQQPTSFLSRLAGPSKELRKLSLYIFTDAAWQPKSDAEGPIQSLVNKLMALDKAKDQVGIQFIRFGYDREGIEHLSRLDSGLHLQR